MDLQNVKRKASHLGVVAFVVILSFMMYATVFQNIRIDQTWHVVWEGSLAEAGEGNPGAGASGFLEIFFVNHSSLPVITHYARNDSSTLETWANANIRAGSGNAWANADNFTLQLKHSTSFDVVVKVRYNKTHAWDGAKFITPDTRVNITASGGGVTISGTSSGTNVPVGNNTGYEYLFVNVCWNNSGSGYQLLKGGTCTITSISIQAKY